jgi:hypothetical protein
VTDMTVGQLIALLQQAPADMPLPVARDVDGNGLRPVHEIGLIAAILAPGWPAQAQEYELSAGRRPAARVHRHLPR